MSLLNILFFAVLCSSALGTVSFRNCEGHSKKICKVKSLHITPCFGVNKCSLEKGQNISIAIEITPYFNARTMKTGVYWNSGARFWPLSVLESDDACSYTSCPIQAGKNHTLVYTTSSADLIEVLPKSTYNVMWKAWNSENENETCCFETTVRKNRRNVTLRKRRKEIPVTFRSRSIRRHISGAHL